MNLRAIVTTLATVLLGLTLSGCAGSPSTPSGATEPVETAESTGGPSCAAMAELACIDSADCTLRQVDGGYACSEAADHCEQGFVQRGGRREECSEEGCVYVPANCYCAPDVTCVCGGGPPAQCVSAG